MIKEKFETPTRKMQKTHTAHSVVMAGAAVSSVDDSSRRDSYLPAIHPWIFFKGYDVEFLCFFSYSSLAQHDGRRAAQRAAIFRATFHLEGYDDGVSFIFFKLKPRQDWFV